MSESSHMFWNSLWPAIASHIIAFSALTVTKTGTHPSTIIGRNHHPLTVSR
jgi:hypothetical protein